MGLFGFTRGPRSAAVLTVVTLSLTVGSSLVVFTLASALWLRPLGIPHAGRTAIVTDTNAASGLSDPGVPLWLIENASAFESVAGEGATAGDFLQFRPRLTIPAVQRELEVLSVTATYFSTLGLLIRGRDFTKDDDRRGAEAVAIISDRLWSQAFRRRPDIVGAVLDSAPVPVRVIGVAPRGFHGARHGERVDVWVPANLASKFAPIGENGIAEGALPLVPIVRLREGLSLAEAQRSIAAAAQDEPADIRALADRLRVIGVADAYGSPASRTTSIRTGRSDWVVAALAGVVLLAGCVALATLSLVTLEARRAELALRQALGASRMALARLLGADLLRSALAGSIGALLVSWWAIRMLPSLTLPGGVDLARLDLSLNWRVLTAAVVACVLVLVVAAVAPMIRATYRDPVRDLVSPLNSTTTARSQRTRQVLLALHACASVVVLIASALFVETVVYGLSRAPGFDVPQTIFVAVRARPTFVRPGETTAAMRERLADSATTVKARLQSEPGVEAVALGPSPIGPGRPDAGAGVVTTSSMQLDMRVATITAGPGYFDGLGIPILHGRPLDEADARIRPMPVVVTRRFARRLWDLADPVGQDFRVGTQAYTVAGVAPDFAYKSLVAEPAHVIVRPTAVAAARPEHEFVVRVRVPGPSVQRIRELVSETLPDAVSIQALSGREVMAADLAHQRFAAWFSGGFGLAALLLTAGTVFALVAYVLAARTREIGIRLALGATHTHLLIRFLWIGVAPVLAGTVAGVMLAFVGTAQIAALMVGVHVHDPAVYLGVAALVLSCSAVAAAGAALKVAGIRAGVTLRAE